MSDHTTETYMDFDLDEFEVYLNKFEVYTKDDSATGGYLSFCGEKSKKATLWDIVKERKLLLRVIARGATLSYSLIKGTQPSQRQILQDQKLATDVFNAMKEPIKNVFAKLQSKSK